MIFTYSPHSAPVTLGSGRWPVGWLFFEAPTAGGAWQGDLLRGHLLHLGGRGTHEQLDAKGKACEPSRS